MTLTRLTCLPRLMAGPFIAAMLGLGLLAASPAALAAAGTIETVIGSARVVQPHGLERPAVRGAEFYEGETLITSANANLKLRMLDDAQIWIRPDTRFKVEKYRSSQHGAPNDEAKLNLISGTMRQVTGAIGKASPSDYRLATPNATIGIRGTEFDAAFITPQAAAQLNTPAGTYNRVYEGSTAMSSASGQPIVLLRGQAGFIGLAPNEPARVLPTVPSFLGAAPTTSSAPPQAQVRRLVLLLRLDGAPEQRNEVNEGDRTSVVVSAGGGRAAGGRPAGPVSQDAVVSVNGNQATVQFRGPAQVVATSGGPADRGPSTLTLPIGIWTEVTGQGPWRASRDVVSSSSGSGAPRVYLRVDEAGR